MNLPSTSQTVAFTRHVVTYAMGAVSGALTLALGFGYISQDEAHTATQAITVISKDVAEIAVAISTLVAAFSGIWSAISSGPLAQLKQVAKNPNVKQVLTDPVTAAAIPSDKVTAAPAGTKTVMVGS